MIATHQELAPFAFLLLAVFGLWIHRFFWMGMLAIAVAAGHASGALTGMAVVWIGCAAVLAWFYQRVDAQSLTRARIWLRAAIALAFFLLALAMALLLLPGFERTVVYADLVLSPGAAPYTLALGFPKVVPGILILGLINPDRVRSFAELGQLLKRVAPLFLVTLSAVLILSLALDYVAFAPKWTVVFLAWALANLFFTCLAEEAFFRGFVQRELARLGGRGQEAAVIAMVASAVLFGLAHFGGGWRYVSLATVAGLGYAIAYRLTSRVEAAMAVHFGVNATHFLLFTYPQIARS